MSNNEIEWELFAEEALKMAPMFVRSKIKQRVEEVARERGITLITIDFMTELQQKEQGK